MHVIKRWLRIERPAGVGLSAVKTVEVPRAAAVTFSVCERAVRDVLGGSVHEADPARGRIEARFGLVNSERITITVEDLGAERSRARVQARRGASAVQQPYSQYVDALTEYLHKALM